MVHNNTINIQKQSIKTYIGTYVANLHNNTINIQKQSIKTYIGTYVAN